MIANQRDFQGLMRAVETKHTLEDIEMHRLKTNQEALELPQKVAQARPHVPVYDEKGRIVAAAFARKNFAFTIPSDIETNTVLEYKDTHGNALYAKVLKNDEKGAQVKLMSKTEADNLKEQGSSVYGLKASPMAKKANSPLQKLFYSLDPSENIVFKMLSALLMFDIFEQESITDIFMQIYLRVLGLGIVIILAVYLMTYVFGK